MRNRILKGKAQWICCMVIVLIMSVFVKTPVQAATSISEEEVYERIIAEKANYPEGMTWTNDNTYRFSVTLDGVSIYGAGCAGFAFILSDAGFGKGEYPARTYEDYSNIRVGDILRINNDTHSVVVLSISGDVVTIAEGNYNRSIHWGRTLSLSELQDGGIDYGITRYPEEDSTPPEFGWFHQGGKSYWYENGVRQGLEGRGKEIYDPESKAWYWLDSVQDGAVAKNKDVYQESAAGIWGDNLSISFDGTIDPEKSTGKWVHYDENGHMVKGWYTNAEGNTYFFDYTYGTMVKGYATIDGTEYYFNTDTGVLERAVASDIPEMGWKNIDGNDYWYENYQRMGYSHIGASYRGKEIYDEASDAWYWLDNVDGGKKAVSKDVYQESDAGEWGDIPVEGGLNRGKWVRYDENGHMIKGWSGDYYFDPTYGTMAKGDVVIDGTQYYFDPNTGIRQ